MYYNVSDKTNLPPEKRVPDKGRPLNGIKRKKEEFTCSPLFAQPRVFKKGFTSNASGSSLKGRYIEIKVDEQFITLVHVLRKSWFKAQNFKLLWTGQIRLTCSHATQLCRNKAEKYRFVDIVYVLEQMSTCVNP